MVKPLKISFVATTDKMTTFTLFDHLQIVQYFQVFLLFFIISKLRISLSGVVFCMDWEKIWQEVDGKMRSFTSYYLKTWPFWSQIWIFSTSLTYLYKMPCSEFNQSWFILMRKWFSFILNMIEPVHWNDTSYFQGNVKQGRLEKMADGHNSLLCHTYMLHSI